MGGRNAIVLPNLTVAQPLGADRGLPFTVRTATVGDLKFIDSLQKRYANEVGFLPLKALEGHLARHRFSIGFENDDPAGYILVKECYQRDPENAILYQCAIEYSAQRHLLGSSLLEHAVGLCPAGTKRASAWVAQDIEANFFWESCGFKPIAARRGSRRKGRVHIFWQRRVDPADSRTTLIAPESTHGGLMREARVVVPIDAESDAWKDLQPEDFPEPPPEVGGATARSSAKRGARKPIVSPAEARRKFLYQAQEWMWVIINGVGRYLPVIAALDVPAFMDTPGNVMVGVGDGADAVTDGACEALLPASRIPGVVGVAGVG